MDEQQARQAIVDFNVSHNGLYNGSGYPGHCPNEADQYLGRPCEYSCFDGYTFACKHEGFALPSMQTGCSTGGAFCPDGYDYVRHHGAIIPSWKAQPADGIFINTGSGEQPGHIEMVVWWRDGILRTFGWDSGPSNVDHYAGQGGCHLHDWECPEGRGNDIIMACFDLGKLVDLGKPGKQYKPAKPHSGDKLLMLKSPLMGSPKGSHIIREVQSKLNKFDHAGLKTDGVYGVATEKAVEAFQHRNNLRVDGIVGPATYHELRIHI